MEVMRSATDIVSDYVWGWPMLALLLGAGIFISFRIGFVQLRHFGVAVKIVLGKLFVRGRIEAGELSPFQALTTALASTVGTGNIAGVTAAVTMGGAGALFWLWVSAVIGMGTKYAEIVLAVHFREKNKAREWTGGPMYYIRNGLGKNYEWLAILFSIFGAVAAFGVGNAVQVGTMTSAINCAVLAYIPEAWQYVDTMKLCIGLAAAALVALTLLGGVKRIGRVTEVLVPVMSAVYLLVSLVVIVVNIQNLGPVLARIVKEAFSVNAGVGGVAGVSIKSAVSWGVRRGVFTNEAGLGSAPIAHATTSERNPVKQGLFGIVEVFLDTIVLCTITGLTLLVSGIELPFGVPGTLALNIAAFSPVLGYKAAAFVLAVAVSLFALATVIGWSLYGIRCIEFLFGQRSVLYYKVLYVLIVVVGATSSLDAIWSTADILNGLMALPNILAIVLLSGTVAGLTRKYFASNHKGR